jgi:hypothetical protein
MVDEISLIGWRDDIGAYLIMQHPRKLQITTQEVMQIYTAHRQNTLYPNFATLHHKGKKVASYFSGMKTTKFEGAPNFITAIFLDTTERPNVFRELLPELSTKLLTNLFNKLSEILSSLKDVRGFVILTKEKDIGGFPVLIYPNLKVSSKLKSDIFSAHFKSAKIERKCVIESSGEKLVSFFTGTPKEKYLIVPNFIVTFFLKEQANFTQFKKELDQSVHLLLSEISKLLAKNFEDCNDHIVELMIEDELKESPIIEEKDFEKLSRIDGEPDVVTETSMSSLTQRS